MGFGPEETPLTFYADLDKRTDFFLTLHGVINGRRNTWGADIQNDVLANTYRSGWGHVNESSAGGFSEVKGRGHAALVTFRLI